MIRGTFSQCTDTIIKHVADIGRMVDEFAAFARMPDPVLRPENLCGHITEALVLPRQAHGDIQFDITGNTDDIFVNLDARQIRQVMTNLIQNAVDSIAMTSGCKGAIHVLIGRHREEGAFVAVTDNGTGFPKDEDITKLTDPYVTHKPKGTGLGLAIAKKIMKDHDGDLILGAPPWLADYGWRDMGGACVVLNVFRYFEPGGEGCGVIVLRKKKDEEKCVERGMSPRDMSARIWEGEVWMADDFDTLPDGIMKPLCGESDNKDSDYKGLKNNAKKNTDC